MDLKKKKQKKQSKDLQFIQIIFAADIHEREIFNIFHNELL